MSVEIPKTPQASALVTMAQRFGVEPLGLARTLRSTVFKGPKDRQTGISREATNEELMALVMVANEYRLNPLLKHIHAFAGKDGGIVPMVGIDGWSAIVNRESSYDGCQFEFDNNDAGKPVSCTCRMFIKGRSHPVEVTEYLDECKRDTDPWRGMPRRMLRHKAYIQAARIAFSLGGIYDEDDAESMSAKYVDVTVVSTATPASKPTSVNVIDRKPMAKKPLPSPEPTQENIDTETGEVVSSGSEPITGQESQEIAPAENALESWEKWVVGAMELAGSLGGTDEYFEDAIRAWAGKLGLTGRFHETTDSQRKILTEAIRTKSGYFRYLDKTSR